MSDKSGQNKKEDNAEMKILIFGAKEVAKEIFFRLLICEVDSKLLSMVLEKTKTILDENIEEVIRNVKTEYPKFIYPEFEENFKDRCDDIFQDLKSYVLKIYVSDEPLSQVSTKKP